MLTIGVGMTIAKRTEDRINSSPGTWFPFYGGLGDIFLRIYQTKFWYYLENSEQRTGIALASVNPFAAELFRWHVNRANLLVYDLANALENFSGQGLSGKELHEALAVFAGLPWPIDWKDYKVPPPPGWKPTFFAPDYLDDEGHFVFHPFAGMKSRSLSKDQIGCVLECLGSLPCNVYIPSRDFIRFQGGRAAHGAEELPDLPIPPNVILLKNLSVPATLNLIRNAKGFIGTQSSLVLAAAHEGIPSLALYPEFLEPEFEAASRYASYMTMDHMSALSFEGVNEANLNRWLSRTFDLASIRDSGAEQAMVGRLAIETLKRGGKLNTDWFRPPDFLAPEERDSGRKRDIDSIDELPRGRYRIWRLDFGNLADFGNSDLAALRKIGNGIDTITNLNIAGTSVTPEGWKHLDWLGGSLRKINLGETDGTFRPDKLASILPGAELIYSPPNAKR